MFPVGDMKLIVLLCRGWCDSCDVARKRKETEKPLLPRIFIDLTTGQVPYFTEEEMASEHYKTAMAVAWKADGTINTYA